MFLCAQYEQHMVLELIKMGHETPDQKVRLSQTLAVLRFLVSALQQQN